MKKFLVGLLTLVLCFTLVGCGEKENNENKGNNNNNENKEETKKNTEKQVTEIAKTSAKNYKINLEAMGIEYEVIDGYYHDENKHLELLVYLNKEYDRDAKVNLHNTLVDYFKTIADDGKVYNLYLDEEYDKADTEPSGIWIRATINGTKCKIYFGGHSASAFGNDSYTESYRITVDPEK